MSLDSRLRSIDLHRLFAASALVQGLGMVATVLLGVQLARYLGPAQYGIYGLVLAAVSILSVVAQFGLPVLAVRAAASSEAVEAGQRQVLTWFLGKTLAIAGGVTATAALVLWQFFPDKVTEVGSVVVGLAAALILSFALLATVIGVLRGGGQNLKGQFIDTLFRPACISAILLAIYLALNGLSVAQALTTQVVISLLALAVAVWLMKAQLTSGGPSGKPFVQPGWVTAALSLSASSVLIVLNGNFPMIIAGLYVSPTDLGILRVALSSVMLLALPASIANIAVGPVMAKLASAGDAAGLERTIADTTLLTFVATLISFIGFALIGRPLISILFGVEYLGSYAPLLILGISQLIVAAFGTSATFLNMTGHERVVIKAFAISVPIGMIAGFFLVRSYGMMGAAFSNIVMVSVWHLYVVQWNRVHLKAPISIAAAWMHWRRRQSHQIEDAA